MPQNRKYAQPDEFPVETRASLDFDSQSTESINGGPLQMRITRTCLECGEQKRLLVSSTRRDREIFTGLCNVCAAKAKLFGVTGKSHPSWQGGVTLRNASIRSMKLSAIKRGYSWGLEYEQCAEIMRQDCFYCGSHPNNTRSDPSYKGKTNTEYTYNGIDRVDNNVGYELANVVSCCFQCNRAKGEMSVEDFYTHLESILSRKDLVLSRLKAAANG